LVYSVLAFVLVGAGFGGNWNSVIDQLVFLEWKGIQ
jgi:hypothetical protein